MRYDARVRCLAVPIGKILLAPFRRILAVVRTETGSPVVMIDLRVQVSDSTGWHCTGSGLPLEADLLPDLVDVLERALRRLPEV